MIRKFFILVVLTFAVVGFINIVSLNSDVFAGISNSKVGKVASDTVQKVKHHDWKFIQK